MEIWGEMFWVLNVFKMWGFWYDKGIWEYSISYDGFDICDFFCNYEWIISGFFICISVDEKFEFFCIVWGVKDKIVE